MVAERRTPDIAKPLRGLGSGVFELALRHRGDAFRVVYALDVGAEIWVVHAFQKKSKSGIGTPKAEIDLIRQRLRRASVQERAASRLIPCAAARTCFGTSGTRTRTASNCAQPSRRRSSG
ncbi:MAG TPA: type II toxin-antitoxin system RelE/ParE family toxin [Stellaceae bacterium]|nr:type II toxin-antitoxin system RelE/ParE family toxin [Stellaceae bacterium]